MQIKKMLLFIALIASCAMQSCKDDDWFEAPPYSTGSMMSIGGNYVVDAKLPNKQLTLRLNGEQKSAGEVRVYHEAPESYAMIVLHGIIPHKDDFTLHGVGLQKHTFTYTDGNGEQKTAVNYCFDGAEMADKNIAVEYSGYLTGSTMTLNILINDLSND